VENTAIDDECTPFPITPYYTAKKLPKIYLGIDDEEKFSWKKPLTMKTVPLAIDIQKILMPYHLEGIFAVLCIDTSNAYNTSYGKREIVVTLHESGSERLLRLTSEEYQQQIQNYMLLRETLSEENVAIIDMRVPQLAFFKGM
ncbi:MAG: hypothetical protein HN685_03045, partial [Waddliaceae bacterium]|nr:hypothetical protein [Waddliaceae bacterium]